MDPWQEPPYWILVGNWEPRLLYRVLDGNCIEFTCIGVLHFQEIHTTEVPEFETVTHGTVPLSLNVDNFLFLSKMHKSNELKWNKCRIPVTSHTVSIASSNLTWSFNYFSQDATLTNSLKIQCARSEKENAKHPPAMIN